MNALRKKGVDVQPIVIDGRKITASFWGQAWCEHLESFSDYENRLPRGRTYVRNGSVCHLAVDKGKLDAIVSGSDLYTVKVSVKTLPAKKWTAIKKRSSGQIGSLLELLQGKLSDHVMETVTDRSEGLFPSPGEITFECSCPDSAYMCKHVAAVLYGFGARLDSKPELLFTLRGVNHEELIAADAEHAVVTATSRGKARRLAAGDISDVFGIEILPPEDSAREPAEPPAPKKIVKAPSAKSAVTKTPVTKTPVTKSLAKKPSATKPSAKKTPVKKTPVKRVSAATTATHRHRRRRAAASGT
jgi:uncharacterized Zn finger protein